MRPGANSFFEVRKRRYLRKMVLGVLSNPLVPRGSVLQNAVFEYKRNTWNALRVARLPRCCFNFRVQMQNTLGTLFEWWGLRNAVFEYKRSRNALRALQASNFCVVRAMQSNRVRSCWASKLLLSSISAIRGTLFEWWGLENAVFV